MDLSIIIVSYNTSDLIGTCLTSVTAADDVTKEVFVIDNASTDGSAALIRENFPSVSLIVNTRNRGFAAASNQVLPQCRGRYIFFLNPDTEVVSGAFREAVSYMDAMPHIGLAGTKLINPDGTRHESVSYRYPGQEYTGRELSSLKGSIACVQGSSMIVHSDTMKDVGGFDEDFFLYGEDQDLCLRIRKSGFEIGYIESAVVIHLGGQSERQTPLPELWQKRTSAELLFYEKHYLPKSIARIRRVNLLQACWRIVTLNLTMPFLEDRAKAEAKLIKYRVTSKTMRQNYKEQEKG
jgi:N-acetylglucosaminyl-diphospho-decaprenol L-rhamnosyltransferase